MDRKLSILLVEDDEIACKEFINYLDEVDDISLIGITDNSSTAVDYVKNYFPDAIILDLELHKGSGNGLIMLQELKNLFLDFNPFILITTNNSSPITYETARQLGADFIMSKHQLDYSVKSVIDFLRIMRSVILSKSKVNSSIHATIESAEIKNKRIIHRINTELNNIGINPKSIGYQYLVDAIQLIINQPIHNLCNVIGEKYGKTESSVERAIQNSINRAWRSSDIHDLLKYYTARISSEKGVPTITEFIFYYSNKIKNDY